IPSSKHLLYRHFTPPLVSQPVQATGQNYNAFMVRPDELLVDAAGDSRCTELAGESPVAVSAGAPRSRPRAMRETESSEWGVKSPHAVVRLHGGEQVRRPSDERTLQPRDI